MKSFSQRKGFKPVAEIIQIDSMNSELRNSLWNVLDMEIWSNHFIPDQYGVVPFSKALWFRLFKKPVDSRPESRHLILVEIRDRFFNSEWFEVYDFLEFVVGYYKFPHPPLAKFLNKILERELSGYRFVSGRLADIANDQELEMLEAALADSQFAGVDTHLQQALDLYTKRNNPDYRNSIKESISAVEKNGQNRFGETKNHVK